MYYIITAVVTAIVVYLLRDKIEAQIIRTVDKIRGRLKKIFKR